MVRIRLARFALPRFGFSGSKSGVSCSPLVCRVRGTIENVRASAPAPKRWGQPLAGGKIVVIFFAFAELSIK